MSSKMRASALSLASVLASSLALVLASSLALGGLGCTGHLSGALKIDGVPFQPIHCRSGKALGFEGVELTDENAARLRLAQSLDGSPMTVYFPPGQTIGISLGACSTLRAEAGTGTVDGVRNLEGNATLSCLTPPHTARGTIRFKDCH
jgi:hypothetical protein